LAPFRLVGETEIRVFDMPAAIEKTRSFPLEGDARPVVKLTLVIDENPVPLAGAFTLGEKAGETRISTRVRVN
jgi:sulfur-oxidizing protein SoxY